jgi:hypothetical protein
MDRIQYFFYTAVMLLYLIAHSTKTHARLWWTFFGVAVGILCLARQLCPSDYLAAHFEPHSQRSL